MNLAETQDLFYRLVTGDPGVGPEETERCFLGSPTMPAAERVEIYTNMYLWRLVDALREDFPKLAALLGDEAFFALCEDYVKVHPSEHPDVGHLGSRLSEFLRSQPSLGRPDLADLAALEWARAEVFFEAPAGSIPSDAFSALGERLANARLHLIPALRILRLDYHATALWRGLENEQTPEPPISTTTGVAVWRTDFEVFHAEIELDEVLALERARSGLPLSEVCATFAGRQAPAEAAFAALASWVGEGWIASIDT